MQLRTSIEQGMSPLKCSWGSATAMGVKLFLVGRIFLARGEYFWLGGTLATFGAVFPRAPYRIT